MTRSRFAEGHAPFRRIPAAFLAAVLLLECQRDTTALAPGDGIVTSTPRPPEGDAGQPVVTVGLPDAASAAVLDDGAPTPNTTSDHLDVDVFGRIGNRYWLQASEQQVSRMNDRYAFARQGDPYVPIPGGDITFVDHLLVTTAGPEPQTADFGKIQVRLVGESTGRAWTRLTLPNFKLDADEFTPGRRIGGVKHVRFNNAIMGGIFREKLVYDSFNRLGYPAPRVTYAWVSSSVWGPDIAVPYLVVESYKPQFCKRREAELGGGCMNMWELAGDIDSPLFGEPESCQFSTCDDGRASEFQAAVANATYGSGYKAQLQPWVDWPSFHRFQCLAWVFELQDDLFHSINNVVLVERLDGKFQYLPYSVDVSLDTNIFGPVSIGGVNVLANGCQTDPQCWADTIAACGTALDDVIAMDPVGALRDIHRELAAAGMLRAGDEEGLEKLIAHLQTRLAALPAELASNRHAPIMSWCFNPLSSCGPYCTLPEACNLCEPPAEALPDAGVAAPQPADCLPLPE